MGTKGHKVTIPNIVELGKRCDLATKQLSNYYIWQSSVGAYVLDNEYYMSLNDVRNPANDINNSGTKFNYYDLNPITKKQGLNGEAIDYFVSGSLMIATSYNSSKDSSPLGIQA